MKGVLLVLNLLLSIIEKQNKPFVLPNFPANMGREDLNVFYFLLLLCESVCPGIFLKLRARVTGLLFIFLFNKRPRMSS